MWYAANRKMLCRRSRNKSVAVTEGIGSQESKVPLNFAVKYGKIIVGNGLDRSLQYHMSDWLVNLFIGCSFALFSGFVLLMHTNPDLSN